MSVDFSHFDSSQVTCIESLFEGCTSLRSVNFGNFDTSKVDSMWFVFLACKNLISVDLSSFDTSKVTILFLMFGNCSSLMSVDMSNFNFYNVEYKWKDNFFIDCGNLKYLNIKNIRYSPLDENINSYLVNGLTERDLTVCQSFDLIEGSKIKNLCCDFNIQKERCDSSNYILLYYNKSVKYNSFQNEYRNQINFIIYNDSEYLINEINISPGVKLEIHFLEPIKTMESFFDSNYDNNMKYLASIDFSHFDASLVTSFEKMFYGCSSLVSINFSNIVTSNVVSMKSMFEKCSSLSSINLYDFNTINVFNMESMFEECSSLLSINLSTFKTNKINNAENMFKHCSSLRILDISNFYFSKYDNDYLNMFDGINNLKYLRLYDISDINKFISKSPLNKINDLYVCQNDI